MNILRLFQCIYGLLMNPEDTYSLDTTTSCLFKSSRFDYDRMAKKWTENYGMKGKSEIIQKITNQEIVDGTPLTTFELLVERL